MTTGKKTLLATILFLMLATVAAYYHDVGKTSKPAYFIENQAGVGWLRLVDAHDGDCSRSMSS